MAKIVILGGGAVGQSCAADLSMAGHSINLFELPRFKTPHIEAIQKRGGIEVTGLIEGLARLNLVTTDIEEAMKDIDIVLICVPAYGIKIFCETAIPYLEDQQTVIFHGKGGHTLEFAEISKRLGVKKEVVLGETHTAPYSSRFTGPGQIRIFGRNRYLLSTALPAKNNNKIIGTLEKLYPSDPPYKYKIILADNVLSTTLCDRNTVHHPLFVLFNLSSVESEKGEFKMYLEGRALSITKIENAIEKERLNVMAGLGIKPVRMDEISFPTDQMTPEEKELKKSFAEFVVVSSTKERYVTEDVPYGMVTIASLADVVGVETPLIDAIINISCVVNEDDYWKTGRKLEQLGLAGLRLYEIHKFVNEGPI